jgi:hypothetical protein
MWEDEAMNISSVGPVTSRTAVDALLPQRSDNGAYTPPQPQIDLTDNAVKRANGSQATPSPDGHGTRVDIKV